LKNSHENVSPAVTMRVYHLVTTLFLYLYFLFPAALPLWAGPTLDDVPTEIVLQIVSNLDSQSQCKLSATGLRYRTILVNEDLNKRLNLTDRVMSQNDFNNLVGPDHFYSNVRHVDLSRATFFADSLELLPLNLESLDLSQSVILGIKDPSRFLQRFSHLKNLILQGTKLYGGLDSRGNISAVGIPDDILAHLPSALELLDLSGNKAITSVGHDFINREHFPNLRYLNVGGVGFLRQFSESFIANLPASLEVLNLALGAFAPQDLNLLNSENFPKLKSLDLTFLSVPVGFISQLPQSLEWLNLTGNGNVPLGDFLTLERLDQLKGISLRNCNINDRVLKIIGNLSHLEVLDLNELRQVTHFGIDQLKNLKSLTHLNLSDLYQLKDFDHLNQLFRSLPSLRKVGIHNLSTNSSDSSALSLEAPETVELESESQPNSWVPLYSKIPFL
jgi:hypothetical protein